MEKNQPKLAEIHQVQLRMLKAVVALCDKHGLRYSIYCGTLLGAARHRGFIPWDDDIDLAMPLQDYKLFLKYADELPPGLVCVHRGNVNNFYELWTKIYSDGTTFMLEKLIELNIHHGLSLDIYPMLGIPNSSFGKKLQQMMLFIAIRLQRAPAYRVRQHRGFIRTMIAYIPLFLRKTLIDLLLYLSEKEPDTSENIGTIDAAPFEGKFRQKDWIQMTELLFEDAYYQAPVQYDKILRRMYGNYMKLPPEKLRKAHFEGRIVDMHRDYRLYRKELLGK